MPCRVGLVRNHIGELLLLATRAAVLHVLVSPLLVTKSLHERLRLEEGLGLAEDVSSRHRPWTRPRVLLRLTPRILERTCACAVLADASGKNQPLVSLGGGRRGALGRSARQAYCRVLPLGSREALATARPRRRGLARHDSRRPRRDHDVIKVKLPRWQGLLKRLISVGGLASSLLG